MGQAYIFCGLELGKKQDAVNAVRKKHSGKKGASALQSNVEESVFYAGETPVSKIADTLQSGCLFSDASIVIVKNAEFIKKKDETDLLVSCIKNLDSSTLLIFISDENKLASALESAVPAANKKVFYEMQEKEKTEWLRQFFNNEGYSISKESITLILELVENNTFALKNEGMRLINFLGSKKNIEPEDIEKWLSHNREESAFTLFTRIAKGELTQALESMSLMLASKQTGQGILAGLAWCFRRLGDYIALLERGAENNYAELAKAGLSSPKIKNDCIAASVRYNADAVEACLAITAEYDLLLRSPVSVMEDILMTRYVLKIINHAAARRRSGGV